jgi:outer membrane protein assembly factor BamB
VTVALLAEPRPSELRLFPVSLVWNEPLDTVVTAPPAFAGRQAFFAVEGGQISAYDVLRGVKSWSAPGAPLSAPATGDGLLFLAEADRLTALRQEDGGVAWRRPFDAPLAVPLVWDNGWLIGADVTGTVFAFRAADGELIWRRDLGGRVHAPPALATDRVYVPMEDGRVTALDVASGALRWSARLGGAPNDMLAVDDRMYVGSDDNFLYCLMVSSGEIAWRWRTGGDVIGVPVIDQQRVYFVSRDNVLRGLDRRSGAQRWKRALASRPTRGPVAAGDVLLVSGLSPRVSAFAMKDGSPAGDIAAPGEVAAAPYVTDWLGLPQVVLVSRDVAKGTRVLAVRRTVDPPMNTPLPVLPNPLTIAAPAAPPASSIPAVATPSSAPPPPRGQ